MSTIFTVTMLMMFLALLSTKIPRKFWSQRTTARRSKRGSEQEVFLPDSPASAREMEVKAMRNCERVEELG